MKVDGDHPRASPQTVWHLERQRFVQSPFEHLPRLGQAVAECIEHRLIGRRVGQIATGRRHGDETCRGA